VRYSSRLKTAVHEAPGSHADRNALATAAAVRRDQESDRADRVHRRATR
jgi:hypothetical protein